MVRRQINAPTPTSFDLFQDEGFLQLFEIAEIANFSRIEQDTYQNSLKYYRNLNNVVNTSREEGREEGRIKQAQLILYRQLIRKLGPLPDDVQTSQSTVVRFVRAIERRVVWV